jgi:translation initiation factor eIF-2B subunit epsilon
MAPKGGKKDDDLAQQEVLQAVVLADSFASHFRPMTFQMPKVLMPLGSVPMIEYTLEFLAAGGVQEIYIFCCAHADEVERYIVESDMERRLATVSLHVLKSQGECMSAGDALREVEARGVIKSDFVLVPGDVIANLSLAPLIAAHKARREVDRDAVLTTVMARVPASHRARRGGEEKLVALSGETGRLLMYDEAVKEGWATKVRLPMALLQETDRFELHREGFDRGLILREIEAETAVARSEECPRSPVFRVELGPELTLKLQGVKVTRLVGEIHRRAKGMSGQPGEIDDGDAHFVPLCRQLVADPGRGTAAGSVGALSEDVEAVERFADAAGNRFPVTISVRPENNGGGGHIVFVEVSGESQGLDDVVEDGHWWG